MSYLKRFAWFCFNLLRNIALLFVLLFCGAVLFLAVDDRARLAYEQSWHAEYCDREGNALGGNLVMEQEEVEEPMYSAFAVPEQAVPELATRVKFNIRNGTAYLRPTQIMYVEKQADSRNAEIITVQIDTIRLTENLAAVKRKLAPLPTEDFVSAKSFVVNCQYVQQVRQKPLPGGAKTQRSYQHEVVMEDGAIVPVSVELRTELEAIMEERTSQ